MPTRDGLPDVVPLLVYRNIEGAHDFLVRAFGFSPGGVSHGDDGTAQHGEVTTRGQVIWLHRVIEDKGFVPPEAAKASTGELVVQVDDVDGHCEQARAAGAEIEYEPMDQPYGVREYGAIDPEGHRWAFVTPLD